MSENASGYAVDVVAVLDSNLNQLFPNARPVKANVREVAKPMDHPLETGAKTVDHIVFQPDEVELACILSGAEYTQVYHQIKAVYLRADLVTIQTRVDSYTNMLIYGIPHEETPEQTDIITLIIQTRNTRFATALFRATEPAAKVKPAAKKNASTVERGEQRPTETPEPRKGSILSKAGVFK